MKRSRVIPLMIVAGLLIAGFFSLGRLSASVKFQKRINIISAPSGADIFLDGALIGETPLNNLIIPDNDPHDLRLVLKGHEDVEALIPPLPAASETGLASMWRPPVEYTQEISLLLPTGGKASLVITSAPSGCDAFLDGRRVGETPLTLTGLRPGLCRVQVSDSRGQTAFQDIDLKAGEETQVLLSPVDSVAEVYRKKIAAEPKNLNNHAELAHHLTIQGKFQEAAEVLAQGFEIFLTETGTNAERFSAEINRIYTRYFEYPPETGPNQIRPACRKMVEDALNRKAGNEQRLRQMLRQLDVYDRQQREKERSKPK